MLAKIKKYFKTKKLQEKELEKLRSEKKELLELNKAIILKIKDPRTVIECVLKDKIEWFNESELSFQNRELYYNDAQHILDSKTFNNVKDKIIASVTQLCLKTHNPSDGLDTVRDAQMTINGIELLVEEFESISPPQKQ